MLIVCDYGDYHHTQQALPVAEIIDCDSGSLVESAYSNSGLALQADDPEAPDDDTQTVVILR